LQTAYHLQQQTYFCSYVLRWISRHFNSDLANNNSTLHHAFASYICIMHFHHAFASCICITHLHQAFVSCICNKKNPPFWQISNLHHTFASCICIMHLHQAFATKKPPHFWQISNSFYFSIAQNIHICNIIAFTCSTARPRVCNSL
jgi:hypothetical protein